MSQFEKPKNENYAATVVKIRTLTPLANCDNLQGIPLFGLQAIVDLNTHVSDIGIVLPTEVQLSGEFVHKNNLFRHSDQNEDQSKVGYIEDNRRVKAVRLRKHVSNALFMPLSSLAYTGAKLEDLKEGDTFDVLNGHEICSKYVVRTNKQPGNGQQRQQSRKSRVEKRFFPEHKDTTQFLRVANFLNEHAFSVVTQKLHGTSIRIGNTFVNRELNWKERFARKVGVKVREYEFALIAGSRKVIKDPTNPNQNHFYGSDIYTDEALKFEGLIPENYLVYGELIGWVSSDKPIQRKYTYNLLPGTRKLYIYRVSFINREGLECDLSWDAVKEFCDSIGVPYVPELGRYKIGQLRDGVAASLMDTTFFKLGYAQAVPICAESPCDEGIVIRIEGMSPNFYKQKSAKFLELESKMLDEGIEDLESAESIEEEESVA